VHGEEVVEADAGAEAELADEVVEAGVAGGGCGRQGDETGEHAVGQLVVGDVVEGFLRGDRGCE